MLCLAVDTAIYFVFFICQIKYVWQLLLNGGDAARILAVNHIDDLLGQLQGLLLNDAVVPDDVDRDVVVNVAQHVQIHNVQTALDFNDVLAAHLVAARVLDDGYLTVGETVKTKVIVNVKLSLIHI